MMIESLPPGILGIATGVAASCAVLALLLAAWRLLVGPTLPDRVVALDLMSAILVVFLVIFRIASGEEAYLFVAIGLALIAFLGTVAFAGYIERTRDRDGD